VKFITSAVVHKPLPTNNGMSVLNKLYEVDAVSTEEAVGKTMFLAKNDYPDWQLHGVTSWNLADYVDPAIAVRACADICQQEGDEWASDQQVTEKNYAHACRDRILGLINDETQNQNSPGSD
jgi:hypothetical protein